MKLTAIGTLALLLCVSACGAEKEPDLGFKIDDVKLGDVVLGTLDKEPFKDRVVLLEFWGINCPPCLASLPKLAVWERELGPWGLTIIGAHAQAGSPDQIRRRALSKGVNFPVVENARVRGADFDAIPHCFLFDHTGKCIFAGHPAKVEEKLRKAVHVALADRGGKFGGEVGGLVSSLRKDGEPAKVLAQAVALLSSENKTTASDAAKLVDHLTAGGKPRLARAEKVLEKEPMEAYDLASGIATKFEGSPLAAKAAEVMAKAEKDKVVAAELKARPILEMIRKTDATLAGRLSEKTDPTSDDFHKANSLHIKQLRNRLAQIEKAAPDAKATKTAQEIAMKYGVK